MRMRLNFALLLSLLPSLALAQSADARFTTLFDNSRVAAYRLDLTPGQRATLFQSTHDMFWVALDGGDVAFVRNQDTTTPMSLRAGDTRYFPSFAARQVRNAGNVPIRGVLVEIKTRGMISQPCDCLGRVEQALCGCSASEPLPDMWAAALGRVTVGGTTLAPGQGVYSRMPRGDTVLVALTPLRLADDTAGASPIVLKPGEAAWVPAGRRRWKNMADTAVRYVTIELGS
jgi:mannose-6-phosphate isomerase-like protein (cupin superfamily)